MYNDSHLQPVFAAINDIFCRAQQRYDRAAPAESPEPREISVTGAMAELRSDISFGYAKLKDVAEAWSEKLYVLKTDEKIVERLLAGDKACALDLLMLSLESVALERAEHAARQG